MVFTIQIGRFSPARLATTDTSIWLTNQSNSDTCICNAINLFDANVSALNYFSLNYSCQIFPSLTTVPEIVLYLNSILFLFQPLPLTQCCSNLSNLLQRIQQGTKSSSTTIDKPTYISMNSVKGLLSVISYRGNRTLFDPTNISVIVNTTSVGNNCAIAAQFDTLFISSCDNPDNIRIYNETSSGLQLLYVLNETGHPRQVVFLMNYTLLLVPLQYNRSIQIYSVDQSTNTFRFNQSVSTPYDLVWSLTKKNDTFIYLCFWETGTSVYTLSYYNSAWIMRNLTVTKTLSPQLPAQVVVDSYSRLWVAVYGYGIQIYDSTGQTLLANWSNVSTGVATLFIGNNCDIYVGDYDNNRVDLYVPNF